MSPKEFAQLFYNEKEDILKIYFESDNTAEVSIKIAELNLESEQVDKLKNIIDCVITDTMYTILLGLDGCASIGGIQNDYKLYDENGHLLAGDCGELEAAAYEVFHENNDIT